MKALLQRVSEASVSLEGELLSAIGPGLVVLVCTEKGDDEAAADFFALGMVLYEARHGERPTQVEAGAAASILAKVTRDRLMADYDLRYPEYGFAGHKGYGCASHLHAIQQYGPSPIHRKSFRPVRESLTLEPSDGQSTLGLGPPLTTANGKR